VIGLPILLGSMWLARQGKLIGLLFWPGALFYGLCNYLVSLFGMPLDGMLLLYLAIVALSIYTTVSLVASIDAEKVRARLGSRVNERLTGGLLAGIGILIVLRSIAVIVEALSNQTAIPRPELALLVVDFLVSGAWIAGGLLIWRRQALGYVGGLGLLFQTSMLFVGLILLLLLRPLFTTLPLALDEVLVVFVMGMICFVPMALFLRGVVKS
jgi:hypothetical protein